MLSEHGLPAPASGLGTGRRALMTLELRESRSSLAGVMVAAAAEGVDFAHLAEHLAPTLEREAGQAIARITNPRHHAAAHHAPASPASPASSAAPAAQAAPAATPRFEQSPAAPSQAPADPAAHAAHHVRHHHGGREDAVLDTVPAHEGPTAYPGDGATPQQLAAWMGARAQKAGLPPELPVMAALTESGLRNLSYGDRDSVGFFQMRTGIWNEGSYAGYPEHPQLQIQWFIDHALAVRAQYPALATSPNSWGEWVANIEQPAAEYRSRYQLQLGMAQELLRGADLAPGAPVHITPPGQAALGVALHYLGTPYRWGGSSPGTGFDCSGLVQYAYAQEGVNLPRVAAEQFDVGIPVSRHDLRPGDAVFFADSSGYVHHVGLYIGDGKFVNAPETGQDVRIASLSEPDYAAQFAGARRYTPGGLADPRHYARPLPTIGP